MKKAMVSLFALCCLILPARAVGYAGFYDLTPDHWAAEQIRQAVGAGAVAGYGDGSFQPGRDVTASQFCAFLSRTFLKAEFESAPKRAYQAMYACQEVLKGTTAEDSYIRHGRSWKYAADEPLTRYDMAQIVYNLLLKEDALQETIHLSTTEIADYSGIPGRYQSAVFTCWGMGILQGKSDGRFAGEDRLNRAQACVIWSRLDALLNPAPQEAPQEEEAPEEIPVKEMPAFGLQGDETVQEMMTRVNRGTPVCQEGCLPNGKPRTEENIQELLELARLGCPDGTAWSDTTRYDYRAPRFVFSKGCLSFGLAVTDFVFGEESPVNIYRELPTLEVGDVIIVSYKDSERALILTGIDRDDGSYTACELKKDGKVNWGQWGRISGLVDVPGFTTVYRRWK